MFSQMSNIPILDDFVSLFFHMNNIIMLYALQSPMRDFNYILNFNPKGYNYCIPNINTQLNHLFVPSTTNTRALSLDEKLQRIIISYSFICQPDSWAQWVRNKIDEIKDGKITNPKYFMKQASLKFYKIHNINTGFHAFSNNITKDIV